MCFLEGFTPDHNLDRSHLLSGLRDHFESGRYQAHVDHNLEFLTVGSLSDLIRYEFFK